MGSVPRRCGTQAVVIGAGIGGLLTARVLADRFEKVIVVERDALPEDAVVRKGVPQGRHFHVVLGAGIQIMGQLFPELFPELRKAGAQISDFGTGYAGFLSGNWLLRLPLGIPLVGCTRPMLELHMRRQLSRQSNVSFRTGLSVQGLLADPSGQRVTGVSLTLASEPAKQESLSADLVADVSGRGSRAPQWLEELGYSRPHESEISIDLAYGSRFYETPPGHLAEWHCMTHYPSSPAEKRTGFLCRLEGSRWICSLTGLYGDHPPVDGTGFLEHARELARPEIYHFIKNAKPLSEPAILKIPSNRRRYFERLARLPAGFVALGDAVCALNPSYGLGMSVAAQEVMVLAQCLDAKPDLTNLPRRFSIAIQKVVDAAWMLTLSEDLRYPEAKDKLPMALALLNQYKALIMGLAARDPDCYAKVMKAFHLLAGPESLFHPSLVQNALRLWLAGHGVGQGFAPLSGAIPVPSNHPIYLMEPPDYLRSAT